MIERIVENWLDKTTERSYQIPFCQILSSEGHTIVHLTRHAAMEMGKDIITLSKEGVPCAYQLKSTKSKRLTLSEWKNEIEPQLMSLATNSIHEGYIQSKEMHRSFIVINKYVDEEVVESLRQFNFTIKKTFNGKIEPVEIISRGYLITKFSELANSLRLKELEDFKTYLEIYLESGKSMLPKGKLSDLLYSTLPFDKEIVNKTELLRSISNASLITASALSNSIDENNHFAEFEGWIIYLSYILSIAEKNDIKLIDIENEILICKTSIYNSLSRLCDELMNKESYSVSGGDDVPLYWVRITSLVGLMSVYGIWRRLEEDEMNEHDYFIKEFCAKYERKLYLWGEYAVPQILAYYFYSITQGVSLRQDIILQQIIITILSYDRRNSGTIFPNPYYNVEDIFDHIIGISKNELNDYFEYQSFALESVLHLFVRTNRKQRIKSTWSQLTKFNLRKFIPDNLWEYYHWRCENGTEHTTMVPLRETWSNLVEQSRENNGIEMPGLIKFSPIMFLGFLNVFPHRINSSGVRWLDSKIKEMIFKY